MRAHNYVYVDIPTSNVIHIHSYTNIFQLCIYAQIIHTNTKTYIHVRTHIHAYTRTCYIHTYTRTHACTPRRELQPQKSQIAISWSI